MLCWPNVSLTKCCVDQMLFGQVLYWPNIMSTKWQGHGCIFPTLCRWNASRLNVFRPKDTKQFFWHWLFKQSCNRDRLRKGKESLVQLSPSFWLRF
jgi:hypothetical protein